MFLGNKSIKVKIKIIGHLKNTPCMEIKQYSFKYLMG